MKTKILNTKTPAMVFGLALAFIGTMCSFKPIKQFTNPAYYWNSTTSTWDAWPTGWTYGTASGQRSCVGASGRCTSDVDDDSSYTTGTLTLH